MLAFVSTLAVAEPEALLVIKNHRFDPAELKVPAGQRVKLTVHNQDATPEEFESQKLNREKSSPPGAKVVIYIGPLKPASTTSSANTTRPPPRASIVAE